MVVKAPLVNISCRLFNVFEYILTTESTFRLLPIVVQKVTVIDLVNQNLNMVLFIYKL